MSTVTLTVATGRVRIPVDKLVGSTYDEAVKLLDRLGLKAEEDFAPSNEVAGTVIDVDPESTAKTGATVTLTVASGVLPAPTEDNKGQDKKEEKKPEKKSGKGGNTDSSTPTEPTPTPAPTTTAPTTEPSVTSP